MDLTKVRNAACDAIDQLSKAVGILVQSQSLG